MEIKKETSIVIAINTRVEDSIRKEVSNILESAKEMLSKIGYDYHMESSIIVKICLQKNKTVPDIRDFYTILAQLIDSIWELHTSSKQSFSAGISIGEYSAAEKSALDLITKYGSLNKIMLDESTFAFVNDDVINLYCEDKEMNNLEKWIATPEKLKNIIYTDKIYYIHC